MRDDSLSAARARRVMRQAEEALASREHLVASDAVFKVIQSTRLSAYDAEFVALAEEFALSGFESLSPSQFLVFQKKFLALFDVTTAEIGLSDIVE